VQINRSTQPNLNLQKFPQTSYLLFFVFAFWGPALGGIPLGPVSFFPARIFALATWALLALALLVNRPRPGLDGTFLSRNWRQVFLGLWLVWAVLSLLWAKDPGQGARDAFNLFIGLSLVGMAPLFINDRIQLNRAAKIWLVTFAIFVGLATIEHLTTLHLPISRFSHGLQPHLSYRPTAVFVNENNFAVFISMSIPFLLARWRYFPTRKNRIFVGLGLFAGIYLLFVTGSRINFIALLLSVIIYSLFLTPREKRLKVLATLMLMVVGIWLIFGVTQPTVRGYVAKQLGKILQAYLELLNPVGGDYLVSNNSIAVRINMIRNGAIFILRTWGMGVGAGNFEAWIDAFAVYDTMEFLNPHNWWIELPTEYGILVACGYLAFFASLIWAAWRGWKQAQGREKWLPEALSLVLAIFPLLATSPNSFLDYLPHWIILALAFAWQQYRQKVGE
jgi:teichuronic acid biosynthesis protein TuaE